MRSCNIISKLPEWCCGVNAEWRLPVWACMSSERGDVRRLLRANPEPLKFKIQRLWPIITFWRRWHIYPMLCSFSLKLWCLWAKSIAWMWTFDTKWNITKTLTAYTPSCLQTQHREAQPFRGHFWLVMSQNLPVIWNRCVNGVFPEKKRMLLPVWTANICIYQ